MKRQNKAGRHAGRVFCAAAVLCTALFLASCADRAAAGQSGQDAAAGQESDPLSKRRERDGRTKQDLRTEPEDMGKTDRVDLDTCETGQVLISGGGDIWLSGSLEGQVIIDAEEDELVHLYLAGVQITSKNGPAVQIREAAKTIVTLVSDTESVLADSPNYMGYEETPACLYSVCDLTINGGGILRVFGYHEDGVRCKDRIRLLDGTFSVQAKGDGIRGSDGVYMQDASVDIESEKNGLRTVNQGADDRGVIEINGGTLSVVAGKNGICAAADLYLYDCQCSVNAVEERVQTQGTAYIAEGCIR